MTKQVLNFRKRTGIHGKIRGKAVSKNMRRHFLVYPRLYSLPLEVSRQILIPESSGFVSGRHKDSIVFVFPLFQEEPYPIQRFVIKENDSFFVSLSDDSRFFLGKVYGRAIEGEYLTDSHAGAENRFYQGSESQFTERTASDRISEPLYFFRGQENDLSPRSLGKSDIVGIYFWRNLKLGLAVFQKALNAGERDTDKDFAVVSFVKNFLEREDMAHGEVLYYHISHIAKKTAEYRTILDDCALSESSLYLEPKEILFSSISNGSRIRVCFFHSLDTVPSWGKKSRMAIRYCFWLELATIIPSPFH